MSGEEGTKAGSKRKAEESDDDDIFEYQSKCIRTSSKTSLNEKSTPKINQKSKKSAAKSSSSKRKKKVTKKKSVQKVSREPVRPIIINDDDDSNSEIVASNNVKNIERMDRDSSASSQSGSVVSQSRFRTPKKREFVDIKTPKSASKSSRTPHKKKKAKTPVKEEGCFAKLTPVKTGKDETFCPCCQLPFRLLVQQSPNWHMTECMNVSRTPLKECPQGVACSSELSSHYQKYRHQILANARAGLDIPDDVTMNDSDVTNSGDVKNPHRLLERQSSSEERPRRLDFGESSAKNGNSDEKENRNGFCVSNQHSPETIQSRSESPDDIFASSSDDDETVDRISESDLFLDENSNIGNCDTPQNEQNETREKSPWKITNVRTVDKFESDKDDVDSQNSISVIEVLSVSHQQPSTSNIAPSAANCKQKTLHSFFHLPDSLPAPVEETKKKGKQGKKAQKTTDTETEGNPESDYPLETSKSCPFYKRIPGTKFSVDAFRYGTIENCTGYFLSHFHYDHYAGLTKKFQHTIYCSKVTGNLVEKRLKVQDKYIHRLPMNQATTVDGVSVTLLEANHCPGAVMFLFRLKDGRTMLHTGDFRACRDMERYPELVGRRIHQLYLDTTYCDPSHAFPAQDEMIQLAVDIAQKAVRQNPRTLIVCGTYTIGKEKIFLALSEALNAKFCVTREKKNVLDCLEDVTMETRMTLDWRDAQIHVLKMMQLKLPTLLNHLKQHSSSYDQLIAFEPTGWTHSVKRPDLYKPKAQRECVRIFGIPYSEHSSYLEMKRFVQFVNPGRILATVNNGSARARQKMDRIFDEWDRERRENGLGV